LWKLQKIKPQLKNNKKGIHWAEEKAELNENPIDDEASFNIKTSPAYFIA